MVDIVNNPVKNNNMVREVDTSFHTLIGEGAELLKAFKAEQAIQPKHISIIRVPLEIPVISLTTSCIV
jgi:hypothetical protein